MATNEDNAIQSGVVLGIILAVLVYLVLEWVGATGKVLWVPTIGAVFGGIFIMVKSCPRCHRLILRGSTKCSECTADL